MSFVTKVDRGERPAPTLTPFLQPSTSVVLGKDKYFYLPESNVGAKLRTRGYVAVLLICALTIASVLILARGPAETKPIKLTLDKKVYRPKEPMVITVKNVSDEVQTFSNWSFNIGLQKWEGGDWVLIPAFPAGQSFRHLQPGEIVQLNYYVAPAVAGRYRIASRIYWSEEENRYCALSNFVEFQVVG